MSPFSVRAVRVRCLAVLDNLAKVEATIARLTSLPVIAAYLTNQRAGVIAEPP
jgi:hypothetical protein